MKTQVTNEVLSLLHDINSPLCALKSLLKETQRNEELELKAFLRFSELSKKLREHFYIDEEKITHCLLDSIENVIDLKEMEHSKVIFSIQSHPLLRDLIFSFCSIEFERTLSNIINNAVEAGASQVCIKVTSQKGKIILRIVDNGNGFYAHDISAVQKRSGHSTKPNGMGIGLGNSIQFLKELGGDLKILSTPYVGTNIILSFPRRLFDSMDFGPCVS